MRYLNLWQTELPPVLDVTLGPINGAAKRAEPERAASSKNGGNATAAPPEPSLET